MIVSGAVSVIKTVKYNIFFQTETDIDAYLLGVGVAAFPFRFNAEVNK